MTHKKMKNLSWEEFDKGVFAVNTLGVVFDTKTRKVLIARTENEEHIPELTWSFPGGRPENGEDFEKALERTIKENTGLKVKSLGAVLAKSPPKEERQLMIYYLCELTGGKEKTGDKFVDLHWTDPEEIEDYFSSGLDPKLKEYILSLK